MRRLHPALFALALLFVAACLRHQALAPSVRTDDEPDLDSHGNPRRLADGGLTAQAMFEFRLLAADVFLDSGIPWLAAGELRAAAEADINHPLAREALSRAAFAYEQAGNRTKARETHELVIRAYPDWEHLDLHWFRIGILAEDERDFEGSQVAYEELLGHYFDAGERWDALFNLARIYERQGKLKQAYLLYVRWVAENPNDPTRLRTELHAATLLSRMGDPDAEREALSGILSKQQQATSADPQLLNWVRARLKQLAEGGVLTRGDGGWVRAPPGFTAMATDGGERTGNSKPKRRP